MPARNLKLNTGGILKLCCGAGRFYAVPDPVSPVAPEFDFSCSSQNLLHEKIDNGILSLMKNKYIMKAFEIKP
jgi:hypothetical protein